MDKPQSFEFTEYENSDSDLTSEKKIRAIHQIAQDTVRDSPACGIGVKMQGDRLQIFYHSYEMFLPSRMKEISAVAEDRLNDFVKHLKKEFKKVTKKALEMKEIKDMRDHDVQKVSLNARYYFNCWRVFEIS